MNGARREERKPRFGNCVATVVVAAWENDLDPARAEAVLAGAVAVDLTEDAEAEPAAG